MVYVEPVIRRSTFVCGGSIIKKKWILTAAHCFYDDNGNEASSVTVYYGNINYSQGSSMTSTNFIIHEDYRETVSYLENDIALIELPSDLDFSDPNVQPVCISEEGDIPYDGKAIATGWGNTVEGDDDSEPTDLHEVALDVIQTSACASKASLPPNNNVVICTLTSSKDTCQGDSGGPLVAKLCDGRLALIGVTSYGDGCAQTDKAGVYAKVASFKSWIDGKTGSADC